MKLPMKLKDQYDAASELLQCVESGMPIGDVAEHMMVSQPVYAEFWGKAVPQLRNGRPLSTVLADAWPAASVSAVEAGERNGKLQDVLDELVKSLDLQREIRKEASKILYPAGILGGTLVVFFVFLLTIIPMTVQSTMRAAGKLGEPTGLAGFGLKLRHLLLDEWMVVVPVLLVAGFGLFTWLRSPRTREEAVRLALRAPLYGEAIKCLAFGIWAKYMAMSCSAGLSTVESLASTVPVLPGPLQDGIHMLRHDLDVRNVALDVAANPKKLPEHDPRREWPHQIARGFLTGQQTGRLDASLARQAAPLLRKGREHMSRAIAISNGIAIAITAIVLGMSMLAIYMPMLKQLQQMR